MSSFLSRLCWKDLLAHQGLQLRVPCTHKAQQSPIYICNSPCDTKQLPTAAKDFWLLFKINIKKLKSSHGLHSILDDQDRIANSLMDIEIKSWNALSLLHTSQTFYPCNSATLTFLTQKDSHLNNEYIIPDSKGTHQ